MSTITQDFVLFELAESTYAVPSSQVRHIEMLEQVTLVPNAHAAIEGVVFSRGQVIPAMNLRVRFGLPRQAHTLRTRLVFAQVHDRTVGLIVDAAREFRKIPIANIRPIEETLTGINGNYLKAVARMGERMLLLLDLEAILNVSECDVPTSAATAQPATH